MRSSCWTDLTSRLSHSNGILSISLCSPMSDHVAQVAGLRRRSMPHPSLRSEQQPHDDGQVQYERAKPRNVGAAHEKVHRPHSDNSQVVLGQYGRVVVQAAPTGMGGGKLPGASKGI